VSYNKSRRRTFTALQRARFFEDHHGVCYLCRNKIDGVHERWEIEHVQAREIMGDGADDDDNLALVHASCHKAKTKNDVAAIAKSNRIRARHTGARPPSRLKSRNSFRRYESNTKYVEEDTGAGE
jgi:5-methylcytosine-specific restriction enzyme A